MVRFAKALGHDIDQTQTMLKKCGYAQLYARTLRDSAIIFCINEKHNLVRTNILLDEYGYELI